MPFDATTPCNPHGRLAGKTAFVTGAGSVGAGWGNGRAIAVRFAQEGARVFGVDRDPAACRRPPNSSADAAAPSSRAPAT